MWRWLAAGVMLLGGWVPPEGAAWLAFQPVLEPDPPVVTHRAARGDRRRRRVYHKGRIRSPGRTGIGHPTRVPG